MTAPLHYRYGLLDVVVDPADRRVSISTKVLNRRAFRSLERAAKRDDFAPAVFIMVAHALGSMADDTTSPYYPISQAMLEPMIIEAAADTGKRHLRILRPDPD